MGTSLDMHIKATVTPGATRDTVTLKGDRYHILVRAVARNGQATRAARALLAHHLGVPINKLSLVRGADRPSKLFLLRT